MERRQARNGQLIFGAPENPGFSKNKSASNYLTVPNSKGGVNLAYTAKLFQKLDFFGNEGRLMDFMFYTAVPILKQSKPSALVNIAFCGSEYGRAFTARSSLSKGKNAS